jgi:hypothetical protein
VDAADIIRFVQKRIEPLPEVPSHGLRYRVSATLTDGTHLPCVVIESAERYLDLAIKRFDDTRKSSDPYMGYRAIVSVFVTQGNRLNDYDIRDLAPSPFAIPLARMREINGETAMSWTAFTATMSDGAQFLFGTTFLTEFFDMPHGYSGTDITNITPAVRGTRPAPGESYYREKPFFTCYIRGSTV